MSCCCDHDTHQIGSAPPCCGGGCHCTPNAPLELTEQEAAFLRGLAQIPFLPLTRFLMTNSQEDDLEAVALAPVYLTGPEDPMDRIRETGALLLGLEQKGLISLDYDEPLHGYDYEAYRTSSAFRFFEQTVREGSRQEGFLFDLPVLELGSMALTALGQSAVEQLDHL